MEATSSVKIGFLGSGRMAQAISSGLITAGTSTAAHMVASDVDPRAQEIISGLSVRVADNAQVVSDSDIIIIAVKPHIVAPALTGVESSQPGASSGKLFISIAAGITIATLEALLPHARVVRVMPNTPCMVQCGASVVSPGSRATEQDVTLTCQLFSAIGLCVTLPEKQLDAVTALSGGGPAYACMMIEALADGGVKMGLPRDIAQTLAAHTLMGSAKMVLETGQHPGQLKDAVCSPGGTTIQAVHALETGGFRASLMAAVESATLQSRKLGGQ